MKDLMIFPIDLKCKIEKKEDSKEETLIVDGFAAVYNIKDLGGDRIKPDFFREDLKERGNVRACLWNHKSIDTPIGINIYSENENGLFFNAKLPMSDSFVRDRIYPQLKIGSIKSASIGYTVIESNFNQEDGCNDLIKGILHESSLVNFPMNPEAVILSVRKEFESIQKNQKTKFSDLIDKDKEIKNYLGIKSCTNCKSKETKKVPPYKNYELADEGMKWDKKKAIKELRQFTNSQESPSRSYKNGFLYYDLEKIDSYGGYKLPYVYVIDNELKAIPRALFTITSVLAGARGGIDIPEEDKTRVKKQINKYYEKMGREKPFKKDYTLIDNCTLEIMLKNKTEMFKIFDDDIKLSNSAKKMLVDSLCLSVDKESTKSTGDDSQENTFLSELEKIDQQIEKQLTEVNK